MNSAEEGEDGRRAHGAALDTVGCEGPRPIPHFQITCPVAFVSFPIESAKKTNKFVTKQKEAHWVLGQQYAEFFYRGVVRFVSPTDRFIGFFFHDALSFSAGGLVFALFQMRGDFLLCEFLPLGFEHYVDFVFPHFRVVSGQRLGHE